MKQPKRPLTDMAIRQLRGREGEQYDVYDGNTPGLGLRVSPGGTRSFFLFYRMGRKPRRFTFGRYPDLTLVEAREIAREALNQVRKGIDPAQAKIDLRNSYQDDLFPPQVDRYISSYAFPRNKGWRETRRLLEKNFVPAWRQKHIRDIDRRDVRMVVDQIAERGSPGAARNAYSAIRSFFNHLVEIGALDKSPCGGMKQPFKPTERTRTLNDEELAHVWHAADQMGYPFGSFVQLLIVTAQRRSEVGSMRWGDLELKKAEWTIPASMNKSEQEHVVPLNDLALEIISKLPRQHTTLVFPARGRDTPISGFSKWKRRLDEISGVTGWRLHDLRRTSATEMARIGVQPHVIERILNHTEGTLGGVVGIYNRYRYLPDMQDSLRRLSDHVRSCINELNNSPHQI